MTLIHSAWIDQHHSTIIAHAQMVSTDKSLQSSAVRALLVDVLQTFGINATLDDSAFPYRLIGDHTPKQFVSFSHSNDSVALIISPHPCGIDVETRAISQVVTQRFFSHHENLCLQNYPTNTQAIYRQILWQLKEAWIKLGGGTLTQGIGVDFGRYLAQIHPQNDSRFPLHDGYLAYINPSRQLSAIYQLDS